MFGRRKKQPIAADETQPAAGPGRLTPKSPSDALKPSTVPGPPPRIPRQRGGFLSMMSGLLTLGLILAAAAVLAISFVEREVEAPGPLDADKVVVVPRTGTSEIAELLRKEGVIAHPYLFEMYAYLNRQRGPLKAGEFLFKARTNIDETIDTLISGKAILHSFTAPEGLTSEQIVQRLRENDVLSGEVTDIPREGSLLPDTYKFERGTTRQQLVNLMQGAQRQALAQVWARRSGDVPIKTPQELIILASIVEKETGKAEERSRVAGVFLNRLAKRMKLQSDPTIVYGLVGGKATLGRGILRSEIERPTPYNTYVIEGLPPGPIANPGRAALEAVANPLRGKDIYFVADGSGGHVFAETLDQHQRNVARWRQIERTRDASGAPAATAVDRTEPPPGPETRSDGDQAFPGTASAYTGIPGSAPPAGRRAFDAVEGTPRDPLRNTSYDLNSTKTVPSFEPQPAPSPSRAAAPPKQAQRKPAPRKPNAGPATDAD